MRFSNLLALVAATTLRPVTSSNVEEGSRSPDKNAIEAVTSLSDKPSQVAVASYEGLDPLSVSARTLHDILHFPDTGESWDKAIELGPNIQGQTDELFQHVMQLYPSEKISEFRESVDSVATVATGLHKVFIAAAEESGISLDSVLGGFGDTFSVLFEELEKMFPPPDEAPSHENRTAIINMVLDRIEEIILQFATKLGISEELLKSHTRFLKLGIEHIVVIIGDLYEQHPDLANTLLLIAIAELLPVIVPPLLFPVWLEESFLWLLRPVLRMFGFGPQGPIKGGIAAWLQRQLFGPAVPKGGLFAWLQSLAMKGVFKRP